ncbi:MAG: hypothetical protein MHPSP_003647, partial [Paramarteilia canceri]
TECDTDFVSRNSNFKEMSHKILESICKNSNDHSEAHSILQQWSVKFNEHLNFNHNYYDLSSKEQLSNSRLIKSLYGYPNNFCSHEKTTHVFGSVVSMISLEISSECLMSQSNLYDLSDKIARHIAAFQPTSINSLDSDSLMNQKWLYDENVKVSDILQKDSGILVKSMILARLGKKTIVAS